MTCTILKIDKNKGNNVTCTIPNSTVYLTKNGYIIRY